MLLVVMIACTTGHAGQPESVKVGGWEEIDCDGVDDDPGAYTATVDELGPIQAWVADDHQWAPADRVLVSDDGTITFRQLLSGYTLGCRVFAAVPL